MHKYVAFLRGINVGGKGLIKMSDLRDCLLASGLSDVRTYIQSGNILFHAETTDKEALADQMTAAIKQTFGLEVLVAIFSEEEWRQVITAAPTWWGTDKAWKHNILILIKPADVPLVVKEIGTLIPGVESLQAGRGVLYQSIAWTAAGRGTTGSKLVSNAAYGAITVRNYNTATKLAALLA